MNLAACLKPFGRSVEDITQIYHGLDHCCRCGCGGNYFNKGERGFTRALNLIQSDKFVPLDKGVIMFARGGRKIPCEGIENGDTYVNIPHNDKNDKCYCLYFDKRD